MNTKVYPTYTDLDVFLSWDDLAPAAKAKILNAVIEEMSGKSLEKMSDEEFGRWSIRATEKIEKDLEITAHLGLEGGEDEE